MNKKHALHPLVREIAKRIEYNNGKPCFTDLGFQKSLEDLSSILEQDRESIAEDLLAFALEFQEHGASCEDTVIQLSILAAVVNQDLAGPLLEKFNINVSEINKFFSSNLCSLPGEKVSLNSANSLFSQLLKNTKS